MSAGGLPALLEACCRLWGVEAQVRPSGAGAALRTRAGLAAEVDRLEAAGAGLPGWELRVSEGGGAPSRERLRSLNALLRRLRLALDPAFVPERALIGIRPRAPEEGP